VAARFDYLSLEDASSGIEGGEQWIAVAGVNWWLNRWSKLQFNYAHTKVTGGPLTASGDYDIDGFGVRAHVDW
jgi:phosphate-selective porin